MPFLVAHGLSLFYEADGDPSDPPVLLIAGLGVQLIDWPGYFVTALVDAGHYVVRFDNRDIGLSTTFDDAVSDPQVVMDALLNGDDPNVAYTLPDMADDAAALLDALGIGAANVVGTSMGGMIAQELATRHPAKVRSLTSIMSTTGAADVGQPTPEALAAIVAPATSIDRVAIIDQYVANAQIWASPGHFDTARMRQLFNDAWDRVGGPQAANSGRHFCAIIASAPRDEALAALTVPSLVVHGTADTLITPSGGDRTAECLADVTLLRVAGMGHDLVPAFTPEIVAAITHLVERTPSRHPV